MSDSDARRRAGLAKLAEVYGSELGFSDFDDRTASAESLPYMRETLDHLFAEIWSRPGLSVRDRRLLTIGVTAGLGRADLAETQFVGALVNEELTREQLGEVVLHLAYYAGWPNAQTMRTAAAAAVARAAELQ